MARYVVVRSNGTNACIQSVDNSDLRKTIQSKSYRGGEAWFALREGNILEETAGRNPTYELVSIDPPPPGSDPTPDINRNPYNFVRLPGKGPWLEDADPKRGRHAGHEIWQPHLLHGHIDLTLTARNPVFSPAWVGTSQQNGNVGDAKFYELHRWENGIRVSRKAIPGSSLKGVLRSMVEALSNDRFGAIDNPSVYAMKTPYRRRVFQLGTAKKENGRWYVYPRVAQTGGTYKSGLLWLNATHRQRTTSDTLTGKLLLPDSIIEEYNTNLKHPHYERSLKSAWETKKPYRLDKLARIVGYPVTTKWGVIPEAAKKKAYSRLVAHLTFDREQSGPVQIYFTHHDGKVDSFGRNANYLWPSHWSVADLCGEWFAPAGPERGLTKALGLAERMFGFVSDHDESKGSHPFRGKLRFEPVWADPNAATERIRGIATAIAPQSRAKCQPLYLVGIPVGDDTLHSASYSDTKKPVIRGRKFYWKQRPPDGESQGVWTGHKDPQVATEIEALAAGTEFTTRIHFDNLSAPELGVLLYALLGIGWEPQDGQNEVCSGDQHSIHIGKYKPRGLGACSVTIDSLALRSPEAEYSSLVEEATPEICSAERVEEFRNSFRKWCLLRAGADGEAVESFKMLDHIRDFQNLHVFPSAASVRYYPQNWTQYSRPPETNKNPDDLEVPQRPKAMEKASELNP